MPLPLPPSNSSLDSAYINLKTKAPSYTKKSFIAETVTTNEKQYSLEEETWGGGLLVDTQAIGSLKKPSPTMNCLKCSTHLISILEQLLCLVLKDRIYPGYV